VVRAAKAAIAADVKNKAPVYLALLGEKARQQMERVYGRYFVFTSNELYRSKVLGFRQAARVAESIMSLTTTGTAVTSTNEFERIDVIYNTFKNMMAFETYRERFYSLNALQKHGINAFSKYELEDGEGHREMLRNLYEFRVAVRMYHMMQENIAAETASRMNAMSNSSKSCDQMRDMLTLLYNRTRQAKITTELVEVISGAMAMKNLAA